MKRLVKLVGIVVFISVFLAGAVVFAEQPSVTGKPGEPQKPGEPLKPQGKCCIAGTYNGVHTDLASPTCKKPETGKYIMHIKQGPGCGSKIWGTIVDPKDGSTQEFTGTVTPGKGRCCNIEGIAKKPADVIAKKPAETIKFRGTLCMKDGKWSGSGKYSHSKGCTGTWKMSQ